MTGVFSDSAVNTLHSGMKDIGIDFDSNAENRLFGYWSLVEETNRTLNLTRVKGDDAITHHFLDSASLIPLIKKLPAGSRAIDVGTGLGVPGVILAILNPGIEFVLLDSLDKRVQFLLETKQKLNLKNIFPVHGRAEFIGHEPLYREKFDLCVSRAVTALPALIELSVPFLKRGGRMLAMKGPNVQTELELGHQASAAVGGGEIQVHPLIVPHLLETRFVVDIEKISESNVRYPRKPNKVGTF